MMVPIQSRSTSSIRILSRDGQRHSWLPHILTLLFLLACITVGTPGPTAAQPPGPATTQPPGSGPAADSLPRAFPEALQADAPELPAFMPRARARHLTVTITNPGPETWFPGERYYLSYHWLNLIGRRAVWDGLRSVLPAPVLPGKSAVVDATLEAPAYPGFYFLQWDIVREGTGWMSEGRGKSPPRTTLVIIYPSLLDIGALASLAIALIFARRRSPAHRRSPARGNANPADGVAHPARSNAPLADHAASPAHRPTPPASALRLATLPAVWCAVALLSRECYVATQSQMHLGIEGWLVRAATAAVVALVLLLLAPAGRILATLAFLAALTLVAWADLLYFRMFGDLPAATALSAWKQLPVLGASVARLTYRSDILLALDLIPGLLLLWRTRTEASFLSGARLARAAALAATVTASAGAAMMMTSLGDEAATTDEESQVFRYAYVAERYGMVGYHVWDAARVVEDTTLPMRRRAQEDDIADFFDRRAIPDSRAGALFGLARGRNVVVIQAESLQRFIVGLRVDGQEITPNLNRATAQGLWFSHVHDQTGHGRTSDAEFVLATSLLPLASGAVAFRYPDNRYAALPGILRAHGYSTLSAVPFDSSFWNRTVIHKTYGFERSLFNWDFQPGLTVGWGLNDRDFFVQMVPHLKEMREPFVAWMISLSLHYPFDDFPDELRRLTFRADRPDAVENYLEAMHLFDRALGEFVDGLRQEGLLDRTLVVVVGDHDAGLRSDDLATLGMVNAGDAARRVALDEVPVVVFGPALLGGAAREYPMMAGQVDVSPTLLGLLGIDPAAYRLLGTDLLAGPRPGPVVKPNGDWITDQRLFSTTLSATGKPLCFNVPDLAPLPLTRCAADQQRASRLLRVSRALLRLDVQNTPAVERE